MVGDICDVDWLSEQLLPTVNDADVATAAVPDDVDDSSDSSATDCEGRVQEPVVNPSSDHCPSAGDMSGLSDDCCPNCPYDRRRRVVVLDCRSPTDYLASHIVGAVHLAVPQLMLRRLKSGHLPASSVIGCLQVSRTIFQAVNALYLRGTDTGLLLLNEETPLNDGCLVMYTGVLFIYDFVICVCIPTVTSL